MTENSLMAEVEVEENEEVVHEETVIDTAKLEEQIKNGEKVSLTKPEFIPEDFWNDEEKQVKLEDLYKAYDNEKRRADGLRQKLSKGIDKTPTKPDEYQLEVSEDIKEFVPDDDILVNTLKELGPDLGIGNSQLNGIINGVTKKLIEKGVIQKPQSQEDLLVQEQERKKREIDSLGTDGLKKLQAIGLLKSKLVNSGFFDAEEAQKFDEMVTDGLSARVMLKMRAAMGEHTIPLVSDGGQGLPSKDEWDAMVGARDEKGNLKIANDPTYYKKLEELRQQMHKVGML